MPGTPDAVLEKNFFGSVVGFCFPWVIILFSSLHVYSSHQTPTLPLLFPIHPFFLLSFLTSPHDKPLALLTHAPHPPKSAPTPSSTNPSKTPHLPSPRARFEPLMSSSEHKQSNLQITIPSPWTTGQSVPTVSLLRLEPGAGPHFQSTFSPVWVHDKLSSGLTYIIHSKALSRAYTYEIRMIPKNHVITMTPLRPIASDHQKSPRRIEIPRVFPYV